MPQINASESENGDLIIKVPIQCGQKAERIIEKTKVNGIWLVPELVD